MHERNSFNMYQIRALQRVVRGISRVAMSSMIVMLVYGDFNKSGIVPHVPRAEAAPALKTVFITTTGNSTWTVPSDWNNASNTVHVIGGGGGGQTGGKSGSGGGGGGAYGSSTVSGLTVGASVTVRVGAGGAAGTAGGDTFFNRTAGTANTCADTVSVCAKGGSGATSATGAAGGAVASNKPANVGYSGGRGGNGNTTGDTGGGGAGAAGPNGAGKNGGAGQSSGDPGAGGGGGGANNGSVGSAGSGNGGAGGNNRSGSGGGAGANNATGVAAQAGSSSGGGGGGAATTTTSYRAGAAGGTGETIWTATVGGANAGPGGGGGGAGATTANGTGSTGGNGGGYGGGGGGAYTTAGTGTQGIIVIQYVPVPVPNPPFFTSLPSPLSDTSIGMTSTTTDGATTTSYYFTATTTTCGTDLGTGYTDSGWQSSTSYTDTGLQPNKCYAYTITSKDANGYFGATSSASSTYTLAATPTAPTLATVGGTTLVLTNNENGNPTANPSTSFTIYVANTSPTDSTWEGKYVNSSGAPSATPQWLSDAQLTNLTITGLTGQTSYSFYSVARNQNSINAATSSAAATTTLDATVPSPNPAYFTTSPAPASTSSVSMTSVTVTDVSTPVAYYFAATTSTCSTDLGTGGAHSGWQTNTAYTNTGLQVNKCYGYTVTARDAIGNTGATSTASTTYTLANPAAAPTLTSVAATTLVLTNNENGNPTANPSTSFAIYVANTSPNDSTWQGKYVTSGGAPSATPVWLSDTQLTNLTITGLTPSTSYSFFSVARNQNNVKAATSSAATSITLQSGVTISGTVYTDEGSTQLNQSGKTIALRIDGAGSYSTTTVSGSGIWSISGIDVATSSVVTVWLDGDATLRGSVVTVASSSGPISGLDLYQNRTIVRTESTNTRITNSLLNVFDADNDADMRLTATTATTGITSLAIPAGTKLYVWQNTRFSPGGPITIFGNGGSAPDGDMYIGSGAIFTTDSPVALAGSLSAHSGSTLNFSNPYAAPVTFTATTSGKTISGLLTGANALPSVIFAGVGGTWTFSNNASTSDFRVVAGTVTAPQLLTITGSYRNEGTFVHSDGTVYISKSGMDAYLSGAMTGSNRFHDINIITDSTGSFASTSPLETPSYGGTVYASVVDGPYLYVAGATTNTIRRYNATTLAFIDESPSYGNAIYVMVDDVSYLYVGGAGGLISRYNKATLAYVDQTVSYGGNVLTLAVDDSYLYAGGVTTNTVRRYNKSTMAYVDETPSYGGTIEAVTIDDNYIYAGGVTTNTVRRYNKSTMAYVDETASYGNSINTLAVDDTHLYAAGSVTGTVRRYNKSTLALVDETPAYGTNIDTMYVDGSHLYFGGNLGYAVLRYTKDNLSTPDAAYSYDDAYIHTVTVSDTHVFVGGGYNMVRAYAKAPDRGKESASYGSVVYEVEVDDAYVYMGGSVTNTVRRFDKSTLAYIDETPSYGGYIYDIDLDDTYLYVGGATTLTVRRYNKATMAYVDQTPVYGGVIRTIALDDTSLYVGGDTTLAVRHYNKSTMAYVDQTASYGGSIRALAVDDTYIYAGGVTTNTVRRYNKSTMAYVDETPSYGAYVATIVYDDTYLYVGGGSSTMQRYNKATMTLDSQVDNRTTVLAIVPDGEYVYIAGGATSTVRRYASSTLQYIDQSPKYGGVIYDMVVDGGYIYLAGGTPYTLVRYDLNTAAILGTSSPLEVDNITITASSTFDTGASSSAVTVRSALSNAGTFTAGSSTMTLLGPTHTLIGTTTFYNLVKVATTSSATTTFGAGSTYTIQGDWTMSGPSETALHKLRSSVDGQYWYVLPNATPTMAYVDVKDSYNKATSTIVCVTGTRCGDSGHNQNWWLGFFSSDADQSFSVNQATTTLGPITYMEPLSTSTVRAATDIRITIASTTTNFRFDTANTTLTFDGSAAGKVTNPVSYENNGTTLVIPVSSDFASGDTLVIGGVRAGSFAAASASTSRLRLYLGGTAAGTPTAEDLRTVRIGTSLNLANHSGGQVTNQFSYLNSTDIPLFGFSLIPGGEYATVTDLTITLKEVHAIDSERLSNIRLYVDKDGNGDLSAGDTAVGGTGTLSVNGPSGTIAFSGDFAATTTNDYVVIVDLGSVNYANSVTLSLPTSGVSATGMTTLAPLVVTGSVTPAAHYKGRAKIEGGVKSDNAAIGDAAPAGTLRSGGTRGSSANNTAVGETPAGDTIGAEVGYFAPHASGYKLNQWTSGTSSLVSDGSYATAASDGLAQTYSVYTFGIPGTNSVTGIIVKLEASASSAGGTLEFALSWDGGNTYTVTKTTGALTTTDTVYTLGTESDTWGRSWTPLEFTDGTFHVRVIAHPNSNTVRIDAIQVKPVNVASGGSKGDNGGGAI